MNIVLIGAQAAGKMTIGQELEKMTDLTLFHNHETIDFVIKFLPRTEESVALIHKIRFEFFETFSKTGQQMIFTVVIDFNDPEDVQYLEDIQKIFQKNGQSVAFVELETDLQERLRRNKTENRLKHKPSKRDLEWSEKDILDTVAFANFNPEVAPENLKSYIKINNTHLSAEETAQLILQKIQNN
ncbi:AAA family ATPase [Streptococcus saliviloxodontae]|nr:AAA family ATPase [Streptococcus saliviloxodontae]